MQISKVLVGVDGSENSNRALEFALGLAEKYNASISILNVFEVQIAAQTINANVAPVPEGPSPFSTRPSPDFSKDLIKIHDQTLTNSVTHAKETNPNLTVSSMLKIGEPALEIVNTAKEGNFDIIVIGHRGAGRMSELILGSVSEKVAHLAPCPVIIVK